MTRRLTTQEFIEKSIRIHGDKYDYSKSIYRTAKEPVEITCKVHGPFSQHPDSHVHGAGCKKCFNDRTRERNKKYRHPFEAFLEKARSTHGDKYTYSSEGYENQKSKVRIICKAHGEFAQRADSHLRGNGCKECFLDGCRIDYANFLPRAREIHGDTYLYPDERMLGTSAKITIVCPKHGSFTQTAVGHLNGRGCASCFSSRGELTLTRVLEDSGVPFIRQAKFQDCKNPDTGYFLYFDFFLPDKNILIEFDGDHHYRPIKFPGMSWEQAENNLALTKRRDQIKDEYAKSKGMELIRIKYGKKSKIVKALEAIINQDKEAP